MFLFNKTYRRSRNIRRGDFFFLFDNSRVEKLVSAFQSNIPGTVIFLVILIKHATAVLFLPRYFGESLSCSIKHVLA